MQTYLLVLFSILLLNILPLDDKKKVKVILPISFLILWVFLAIRYNYGVDYITYHELFYGYKNYDRSMENEPLFWWLMSQFDYYYIFIIFQTTAICLTVYYFVQKYIPSQYYWLFFLIFMCHSGMMFTITTAIRSGFAAIVFMWGTEFFYLRKFRPLLYLFSIYLAYLFHNSAILLLLFPFADYIIKKISQIGWIVLLAIGLIISITNISNYLEFFLTKFSSSDAMSAYSDYIGGKFVNSSITVAITHLIFALPGIFIFKSIIFNENIEPAYKKISSITLLFMLLHIIGIDFQNRLTVCVCILYIISISKLIATQNTNSIIRHSIICVVIFNAIWNCYVMFSIQAELDIVGSFWYYHTIFDAPRLP